MQQKWYFCGQPELREEEAGNKHQGVHVVPEQPGKCVQDEAQEVM